jgi:hypothetical protein
MRSVQLATQKSADLAAFANEVWNRNIVGERQSFAMWEPGSERHPDDDTLAVVNGVAWPGIATMVEMETSNPKIALVNWRLLGCETKVTARANLQLVLGPNGGRAQW